MQTCSISKARLWELFLVLFSRYAQEEVSRTTSTIVLSRDNYNIPAHSFAIFYSLMTLKISHYGAESLTADILAQTITMNLNVLITWTFCNMENRRTLTSVNVRVRFVN